MIFAVRRKLNPKLVFLQSFSLILFILLIIIFITHINSPVISLLSGGLILIICLIVLSAVWPPDSPWAPWWKTSKETTRALYVLAKIKKTDHVYELGSGDGEALITLAKEYGITSTGIEIDPLRVWHSRFRIRKENVAEKVTILKKNFFEVDISPATVLYVYLVPKALLSLQKKFMSELRPGTRVVSYRYKIPYLPLVGFSKEHFLYLYEMPKRNKK